MTAMTTDTVERFIRVFRGRGDAHGSWQGGAIRQPLTRQIFERHLTHGPHIGVYPLIDTRCSWGCIDIDGKDFDRDWDQMWAIADNLRTVLKVKSVHAHHERTANGIHVWVFPDAPIVPAAHMRRSLMAACVAIGYSPKEVNPKQEDTKGGLGNYVRLPYYGALSNGTPPDRYMTDADRSPLALDDALDAIEGAKTDPGALEELSHLWEPPQTAKVAVPDLNIGSDIRPFTRLMNGRAWKIWSDGPLDGADRSGTLIRLAGELARQGLPTDVMFVLLKTADQRWGKYYLRPDCDEQLVRIIERVTA